MAYVSVYLSDSIARYPVRAVTKPRDNKSDPNLETGTYGLFSTCQMKMRKSIVRRGVRYIFFVTTHGGRDRALTGFYRVRWYAPGPDQDYALAADAWRFVDPVGTNTVGGSLRAALEVRRGYTGLDGTQTRRLLRLLESKTARNDRYLAEIDRLERLSARYTGFRYPTWERESGWRWADAATYLAEPLVRPAETVPNTSPSDLWVCGACTERIVNKARLKRCPKCGALATLRPLTVEV